MRFEIAEIRIPPRVTPGRTADVWRAVPLSLDGVNTHLAVLPLRPERFAEFVADEDRWAEIEQADESLRGLLEGRALWHVSSSSGTGGVAELIRSRAAYARGLGIDARWEMLAAEPELFALAARMRSRLHGDVAGEALRESDRRTYDAAMRAGSQHFRSRVASGDVVVLHDVLTAGLAPAVRRAGAHVVWRCHVGVDEPNDVARGVWRFLQPYLSAAEAFVFTRPEFAWEELPGDRVFTFPPLLNPLSPKNADMSHAAVAGILATIGLHHDGVHDTTFVRLDGTSGRIDRRLEMLESSRLRPDAEVVLQVGRWSPLKDPVGVIELFGRHVAPRTGAHLLLAGPRVDATEDEPDAASVYGDVAAAVRELDPSVRARVHVAQVPSDDADESAAIINALQRRASVVVQKSRGEGFGLAVLEAMWKRRPVVCSRVGGLQDQVVDGETGYLVAPGDGAAAGAAVVRLLEDPDLRRRMGDAGQRRVRAEYLLPYGHARWLSVFERVLEPAGHARA